MRFLKSMLNAKWKRWVFTLVVLCLVMLGGLRIPFVRTWSHSLFGKPTDTMIQLVSPKRGTFIHEVTVRGDISSSSNLDIKCEVRSNAGTMLLSVIDEGATVKKGDLLAVLDSSALIDNRVSQEITCSSSQAELATAENDLETAIIAKKEYEEGTYLVSMQKLESAKIQAEEERSRLAEYLEHSKKLYKKGFVTKQQLDADAFSLKQAELDLEAANLDIKVLKEYTFKKSLISYDSNIKTAEAKKLAKENAHKNNMTKLADINQQIESCRVLAPADGKVIYANETRGPSGSEFIVYEGATIRERQTFLRLPDPSKLQVVTDVHEGKINFIKTGMIASIRTDATAEKNIKGTVIKVNELPQPTNHWMGNVKEYRVTIKIDSTSGVLPGMTADTRILVEQQENVVTIPTHAVFEYNSKFYCILSTLDGYEVRELELGSSNDKVVIIKSGVTEQDQLVADAFQHRDKITLPDAVAGHQASADIRTQVDPKYTIIDQKTVDEVKQEAQATGERRRQMRRPGGMPGADGKMQPGGMPGAEGKMQPGGMPRADGKMRPSGTPGADGQMPPEGVKLPEGVKPPEGMKMPEGKEGEMPKPPEGMERMPPPGDGGTPPPPPPAG